MTAQNQNLTLALSFRRVKNKSGVGKPFRVKPSG